MKKLSLLVLILTIISCSKPETAIIKGSIKNIEAEKVLLIKIDQDSALDSIIEIPVIENKFSFETKLESLEGYKLFLNQGQGPFVIVFPENGVTNIEIFGENLSFDSKVSGGKLNYESNKLINKVRKPLMVRQQYIINQRDSLYELRDQNRQQLSNLFAKLQESDNYPNIYNLQKKAIELRDNEKEYYEKNSKLQEASQQLEDEYYKALYDYIDTNNTLVSYFYLLRDLKFYPEKFKNIYYQERLKKYAELYPNHKYTMLSKNWLEAALNT